MILPDIKRKLGTILPKDPIKLTVKCRDLVLKKQLEKLLECVHYNLSQELWDLKDYKDFLKQLSFLEIDTFQNLYLEILEFVSITKEELYEKLTYYDKKLELHLFDDDRILHKYKDVVKDEKGKEIEINKEEYIFVSHVFSVADLPKFFQLLNSKIIFYNNIIIKKYDENKNENVSINEQIEELKLLIDMINNSDLEIISLIEKPYLDWINGLPTDSSIFLYLKNMLSVVINNNKINLKTRIASLTKKQLDVHRRYLADRQVEYMSNQAKDKVKKTGYKFG